MRDRKSLGIQCAQCFYSELCLPKSLTLDEMHAVNDRITQMLILKKGDHLYYQEDEVKAIYAIYAGYCKEYGLDVEGNERIDNFYFPGDIMGLASIPKKKQSFSAMALTDIKLCVIPTETLLDLMSQISNLMKRFIHIMSYKMQDDSFIQMTTNVKSRVANFLLKTLYRYQERKISKDNFCLPMSKLDISHYLGIAYETLSRTLHELQRKKIIEIKNDNITILDSDQLITLCKPLENYGQD